MSAAHVLKYCVLALLLALAAPLAHGADPPLESLLGSFAGTIRVDRADPVEHRYQTEVVSLDSSAGTVSLTADCLDCGVQHWVRSNCEITEAAALIRFVCRGPATDESYSFDGANLEATGFGKNYPYSIRVTKVSDNEP